MPDERQRAVQEIVAEWMQRARSDLAIANMIENHEISPEIIAFHAQQAVEKGLKALLIQRQVEFPRTHVIGVLLEICKTSGYSTDETLEEASTLSPFAVAARYPGETEPVNRQEAEQAVVVARRVFRWVESKIESIQ